MPAIRRSLLFTFGQKYVIAALNLLSMVIVSRLLAPSEVGVFMVANSLVLMADSFRDFGVSNYLIQARALTAEGRRTAFTVTLITSLVLAAALFLASGTIAAFYGAPGVRVLIELASSYFLVLPFGATAMAMLRRELAFDVIAGVTIAGAVAYFISVIALAWHGFGYMSLAWASLLNIVVVNLGAMLSRGQFSMYRPSLEDWRRVLSFGGLSSATALLNIASANLPQLILGRVLGFGAVGLYSRATVLTQQFDRIILDGLNPILLPSLAQKVREGHDLRPVYLQAVRYVTALHWPFLLCLALLAGPIVDLLLGHRWSSVAPLVRIIAIATLCYSPAFLTYPVLVARGRIGDTLSMSLLTIPPTLAIILGASLLGLEAVAWSLFLTLPLQVLVAIWFVRRQLGFSWGELLRATAGSAVAALAAAVPPALAVALHPGHLQLPLGLAIMAAAGALLGWAAGLVTTRHPLLAEVGHLLSSVRGPLLAWRMTRPGLRQ
jgi:O-antigen/teichoic acid export membrane protein